MSLPCLRAEIADSFCKGADASILGFVVHTASAVTIQLSVCNMKAADSTWIGDITLAELYDGHWDWDFLDFGMS